MKSLEDMRGKIADTGLRKELAARVIKGEIIEVLKDLRQMPIDQVRALFYARFYQMHLFDIRELDQWALCNTADELDRYVDLELDRRIEILVSQDVAFALLKG
ncbi:MAG TPA: hypothetical protein P5080_05260 [Candidatus Paceibacterota bacterium]|nr:hypothetical protein [Candidatus Pacearchaeota archaeon]HRZ51355.1 hypothetical protein [Candidatus Paceibacterota bacterium]HSA37077.1 hypothetical protein [Candidatus Paceibacterota bacterium]